MSARDAVIVDAVRTPVGKRNGSLAKFHAVDLSAHVLNALAARNGFDPAVVDDVIIAGGVEMMSGVPMGATSRDPELGRPGGPKVRERYGVTFNQGIGAEMMADKWGLSRDQLDEFSSASHAKLAAATDEGRLAGQIAPVDLPDGQVLSADEGLRRGTSPEKLAALKPAFNE